MNVERIYEKYRGISPGAVIGRELKKKGLRQNAFAAAVGIPPQTLNAIIKGSRKLTPEMALKIDYGFGFEESTMAVLQAFYETRVAKQISGLAPHPNFPRLRRVLFWDTDFDKIDWLDQKTAVIHRVYERGNEEEKDEIERFYGRKEIDAALAEKRPGRSHPRNATQQTK